VPPGSRHRAVADTTRPYRPACEPAARLLGAPSIYVSGTLVAHMHSPKILLHQLDPELPVPRHAQPGDAGVDLFARSGGELAPGERSLVPTGVAVAVPAGYVGLVAPRSGLAIRSGISLVNSPGVVDSGYRGEIQVVLVNQGSDTFRYERGERIAQLVVVPFATQDFELVDELPPSERGADGFGSTGA